jgi:hypothetical protein
MVRRTIVFRSSTINPSFPDTFGWTQSYFGGMPFPNFYPPLFYWCVALLHHTQLFSFEMAFKLMTAWPIILMPAVLWIFAWRLSNKNIFTATWAALLVVWLMTDPRSSGSIIWPSGLDYHSTVHQRLLYTAARVRIAGCVVPVVSQRAPETVALCSRLPTACSNSTCQLLQCYYCHCHCFSDGRI